MRTLYLRAELKARLEPCCVVLHVTPLLRELIVEIVRTGQLRVRDGYECALCEVLLSQLKKASPLPTFVTLPRERRALAVAQAILRNPAEPKPMAAPVPRRVSVSGRSRECSARRSVSTLNRGGDRSA